MTIHFEFIETTAFSAYLPDYLSDDEYTALQVKKAVVGQGKAQKAQVQDMVQRLLLL